MALVNEKCTPPVAGTPPLAGEVAAKLHEEVPQWTLGEDRLRREFKLPGFPEAMAFAVRVAEIAQAEDHHPEICINYNRVALTLTTHKLGGLSRNDFIIAAKLDRLSR
jgi:4a-hydroxytetrahydrobiopterin dehydratase